MCIRDSGAPCPYREPVMLRVRPETERQMDRRGCSQMWATAKYSATWGIRQLPGMCWHPAKRSICRGEPSSPANLMQQLRASGSGTDLSSASPCNDKKWAADTMYLSLIHISGPLRLRKRVCRLPRSSRLAAASERPTLVLRQQLEQLLCTGHR